MTIAKFIETSLAAPVNFTKTTQQETQKKPTTLSADNADKFDANTAAYNKNFQNATAKTGHLPVQAYKGGALQIKNALMQEYANYTFGKQSGVADVPALGNIVGYTPQPFAKVAYEKAEATSEKYEDYWGSDAVSERLFTFAKTLAGDNDEMFGKMKNAFLKGFRLAEGAKAGDGAKLPKICYETKDKVLGMFDKWEADIKGKSADAGKAATAEPEN